MRSWTMQSFIFNPREHGEYARLRAGEDAEDLQPPRTREIPNGV